MEQQSQAVEEGRFIHETSYSNRASRFKEVAVGRVKIDYYDPRRKVVHEIKKSDKIELAHVWQLKYYLYKLQQSGIDARMGILEYPKLRVRKRVVLKDGDEDRIKKLERSIEKIVSLPRPPEIERKTYCRSCSYYEFCFVGESQ
jgi:CRISPR-associated exonuclease Cas4